MTAVIGSQTDSAQGNVVNSASTAVVGSQTDSAQGPLGETTLIGLKSRKIGSGTVSFQLVGAQTTPSQGSLVNSATMVMTGASATVSRGILTAPAAALPPSNVTVIYDNSYPTPTLTDPFVGFTRTLNFGKHTSPAYCPLDQLIYLHGGDGQGWHWGGDGSGTMGTVDTWNPVTKTYAESFLYRGVSSESVPRGVDHMCFTWSPNLGLFWSGPGLAHDTEYTAASGLYPWQDYTYLAHTHYATYDTVTKKFTDKGARQVPSSDEGQQAGWDSRRNALIYWKNDNIREVDPTTLAVTTFWHDPAGYDPGPWRNDENNGWYDADTDDYYFWVPQTGDVIAVRVNTPGFAKTRLIVNTGVTMAISATRATVFIPEAKHLLIVYSVTGPNATNTAQVNEGGALPWKLINLTTGVMTSMNLFHATHTRSDHGTYHPPSKTIVLSGGGSDGNLQNGAFFHHYNVTFVPSWVPLAGQVAAISGPGTAAPNTLSSVLYGTAVDGFGGAGLTYFSSWCSGVYAPNYGTYGAIAFANGGDGDYFGNEGYVFEFDTRTWKRLGVRSTGLNGLRGSPGADPNFDDSAWGEHTTPGGVPPPQPGIPHNYDAVEYLPPSMGGGINGSLLLATRSAVYSLRKFAHPHYLDLATGTWHRGTTAFGAFTPWNQNMISPTWFFDSFRNRFWGMQADFGSVIADKIGWYTFNSSGIATVGAVWPMAAVATPSRYPTSRYWPTGDLMLTCGIGSASQFIILAAKLSTLSASVGLTQLTLTGDIIPFPHPGGSDAGGYGFTYCSDLDCFFVRTSAQNRQIVYQITPPAAPYLTNPWNVTAITMGGATVSTVETFQGMWKRFNYCPSIKCLTWVDDPNGAVYAYRPVGV